VISNSKVTDCDAQEPLCQFVGTGSLHVFGFPETLSRQKVLRRVRSQLGTAGKL